MSTSYDAIIIGTGQSGPSLADRLDREGMKVAVVERKLIGGTRAGLVKADPKDLRIRHLRLGPSLRSRRDRIWRTRP